MTRVSDSACNSVLMVGINLLAEALLGEVFTYEKSVGAVCLTVNPHTQPDPGQYLCKSQSASVQQPRTVNLENYPPTHTHTQTA
jgi:hypothetical protein